MVISGRIDEAPDSFLVWIFRKMWRYSCRRDVVDSAMKSQLRWSASTSTMVGLLGLSSYPRRPLFHPLHPKATSSSSHAHDYDFFISRLGQQHFDTRLLKASSSIHLCPCWLLLHHVMPEATALLYSAAQGKIFSNLLLRTSSCAHGISLNSFTIWHPMYKCQLVLKSSACPHLLVQLIDSWTGWVYIILLGHLSGFSLYTCLGASPTDPISSMRSCKEWLIFLVFFSHSNNAALSSSFSCVKCFIFFFNMGWRYFNLHYSHVAGETLVTNKWYLFCR